MTETNERPIRVLFVNRMASMVRGGGETFDLEIARHLAGLGCEVTFLTGIPLFGKAVLGPEEWWGGEVAGCRLQVAGSTAEGSLEAGQGRGSSPARTYDSKGASLSSDQHLPRSPETCNVQPATESSQPSTFNLQPATHPPIAHHALRSPYFGWFPWDKTPGGWRLRVADFKVFEYLAARWAWNHRDEFDVIQVCELPFFVHYLSKRFQVAGFRFQGCSEAPDTKHKPPGTSRIPIVMRLTAPDYYDPVDGLRLADAVIASGDTMRKVREKLRPDCRDVPNGVDVELFRPQVGASGQRSEVGSQKSEVGNQRSENRAETSDLGSRISDFGPRTPDVRARYNIPADAFVITLVGRFQSVKNHAMLVDAFARLNRQAAEAWLVLAGSGPLRGEIEGRCRQAGVGGRVVFLGEVKHSDLPEVYRAADVNVISSDYESFCFAVLEGMASGLPHVVTATNWVPWLIGGRKAADRDDHLYATGITRLPGGFVTPIGDAAAFAEALLALRNDRDLGAAMGRWARERAVSEFSWGASAARLCAIYGELSGA